MWSWISNFLAAAAGFLRHQTHRSELRNAPDVRRAAVSQMEVKSVSRVEEAVAKKDITAIRKELAE